MKRLFVYLATGLLITFAFSSVALAGVPETRDVQQNVFTMMSQEYRGQYPVVPDEQKPPVQRPPNVQKPPAQKPPTVHRPPAQRPPTVHKDPGHRPPTVHKQPGHRPPTGHRPPVYRHHNPDNWHHWGHDWPRHRNWHHHFHDWNWFVGFGILTIGAYYVDNDPDRVVYVQFETERRGYLNEVTKKYGSYIYRERANGFGGEGWRYYWIGEQNITCVYIRDDGHTRTFVWNRAETEGQAIALGLIDAETLAEYRQYNADMPPDLAVEYIMTVLWSQTEWQ